MTPNRFSDLKDNGRIPRLTLKDALALIPSNGSAQVPTALRHDSFTFVAPEGPALLYLNDVKAIDAAFSSFDVAIYDWGSITLSKRMTNVKVFTDALNSFATSISSQSWPSSSQKAIRVELREVRVLEKELHEWSNGSLTLQSPIWRSFVANRVTFHNLSDDVRASLRLPPA
jgi:hypothetical protein